MGLKKYENYSPSELSKGTMQRLNNACAMIQEEKITIFDEPFSGLDPVQMKLLENVMVEFHKKEKGIYIISSHDIECLQMFVTSVFCYITDKLEKSIRRKLIERKSQRFYLKGNKVCISCF